MMGQGGRQEEPRVGDEAIVVEGGVEAVSRRSRLCDDRIYQVLLCLA